MSYARDIIAFDMDGVLVDSKKSIIKSLNVALLELGFQPVKNSRQDLIGMAIREMLLAATNNQIRPEQLKPAIARYRAANNKLGPQHTAPYKGILVVLQKLTEKFDLIVITSKLQSSATELLQGLKIDQHFIGIFGPEIDGINESKESTLSRAVSILSRETGKKVTIRALVGDRATDVIAAKKFGVQSVAALWGYGTKSELGESDAKARRPHQLITLFNHY